MYVCQSIHMNTVISETIKAAILGLGMQILRSASFFVSLTPTNHTKVWCFTRREWMLRAERRLGERWRGRVEGRASARCGHLEKTHARHCLQKLNALLA